MGSGFQRARLRPARIALVIVLALTGLGACLGTPRAEASYYKMLLCAGGVGAGEYATESNTGTVSNPGGIFLFENHCGPAPVPAGNAAFVRIVENEDHHNAGDGAFGRFSWSAPEGIQIAAAGGYTREPDSFNEGWRARYWVEGYGGGEDNILYQGTDAADQSGPLYAPRTTTFAPHLWPYGTYGAYRRFSFELLCVRQAGCDRINYNAADSNTMLLTLNDPSPPSLAIGEGALASGRWVRGPQPVSWSTSEAGSGLRWERLRVDGAEKYVADYGSQCDLGSNEASGEYARSFQPCPRGGPFPHSVTLDTSTLGDGVHSLSACAQDFGQASGIDGSGGESCDVRTVRTDNTAPGAPLSLAIGTPDPSRYANTISASWALPADPGSPITKVHYWMTDAAGNVVSPERVLAATNPTGLAVIEGPAAPGAYQLNVALEDEVGFVGPAATVAIPHDAVPPAAPQDISVTPPSSSRSARGFDVQWRNIVDAGSPIDGVHYEVLDAAGKVVVPERTVLSSNPEAIADLATPPGRGAFTLRVWLSDAEGNVGAPASVPLAFDCLRSDVKGAASLSATFGPDQRNQILVPYGSGATVAGSLRGGGRQELGGAPICVYSRIVTSPKRRFLGVAITDAQGTYEFPVPSGASRELAVENRPGQRTVRSRATLLTRARPTLRLASRTPVHNKTTAVFRGRLPGPDSGAVLIVLQVKDGSGWTVFRRVTTRPDGAYEVRYPFTQTVSPRTYTMRTQMPPQKGVPYHSGSSELIDVPVRP